MKKLLISTLLCAGIFATSNAQVSFGVHANGLIPGGKLVDETENKTHKQKARFSWKFGVVADIDIIDNLSFMPQLNILSKGGDMIDKYTETQDGGDDVSVKETAKPRLTFLELPLNVVFKQKGFFAGLGPVFSFAMNGTLNETITYTSPGETYTVTNKEKVKFDGKKNEATTEVHMKGFEFGANALAGYKFENGLFVKANYHLGFTDLLAENDASFKNNYFSVGVGYFFSKKKK